MSSQKDSIKAFNEPILTGTSDSILASLFKTILHDIGITASKFNVLIERYIIRSNIPQNIKEISSTRGNLKKELLKSTMTWKVFTKALVFIGVKKFELIIRIQHSNDKITEHTKIVNLTGMANDLDDITK